MIVVHEGKDIHNALFLGENKLGSHKVEMTLRPQYLGKAFKGMVMCFISHGMCFHHD